MYRDVTSIVTSITSLSWFIILLFSEEMTSFLMKSVVSLTYEGSHFTKLLVWSSTKAEIFSVGHPFPLMMGLPFTTFLCILGRK